MGYLLDNSTGKKKRPDKDRVWVSNGFVAFVGHFG